MTPRPDSARPRRFTQARARKTYEALIAAGTEVFAESGFDGTQTPDVASRAGVSVGTFYRYFDDKRALFLEVMERHIQRGSDEVMAQLRPERFAGKQSRATIEHTLAVLLDNVTRFPALEREFLSMSLRDREVAALRRRLEDQTRARIVQLITAICTREQVADPEATAYVVHTAAVECAIRIAGLRGEPPLSRERALEALGVLMHRTLFGVDPEVAP
jgi:AcrR family transcriptional regulator